MPGKRDKLLQTAEKLVARGKLDLAINEYRKVLKDHPRDTSTLNRIGDLYARLDRTEEAIKLYSQIADLYSQDGFFVKAIAIYKKIIRLDPTELRVYEKLAELYHRQGLINEARTQYQVVADYYAKHRDMASAVRVHEQMAQLEPDNPMHRVRLAELHQREGHQGKAIGEYQKIAELMLKHGHVEEATKVYLRALDVDARDLGFITRAVLHLKQRGSVEAAGKLFHAAVDRNPQAERVGELAGLSGEAAAEQTPPPEPFRASPRPPSPPEPAPPPVPPAAEDAGPPPPEVGDGEEVLLLELDEVPPAASGAPADLPGRSLDDTAAWSIADELEFDFDLETMERELAPPPEAVAQEDSGEDDGLVSPGTPPPPAVPAMPRAPTLDIDPARLDEAAADLTPVPRIEAQELLAEAEVFARYGLHEKAIERLDEVLALEPNSASALSQLADLALERGHRARAIEAGSRLAALAAREPVEGWDELLGRLLGEGFRLAGTRLLPPEEASQPPQEEEAELPEPAVEELLKGGSLEWLEQPSPTAPAAGELFQAEQEFFDLAAELDRELREEEGLGRLEPLPEFGQESLEEIVEGFKRGVAQSLSPEDFDTHFNLGIAYREMGLLDEAIGEFQLAAKAPDYLVDCCSLLASCFREKGFPELAVKWFRRALDSPMLSEEAALGILYELGNLYMASDDHETARKTFIEIYGMNSNYRDVVAKLEELGHRR